MQGGVAFAAVARHCRILRHCQGCRRGGRLSCGDGALSAPRTGRCWVSSASGARPDQRTADPRGPSISRAAPPRPNVIDTFRRACAAHPHKSTAAQRNSSSARSTSTAVGRSPAGSRQSRRITCQDWTERVGFFAGQARAHVDVTRRKWSAAMGGRTFTACVGRAPRREPNMPSKCVGGVGGDRTRCVDDTHDGQHRTR